MQAAPDEYNQSEIARALGVSGNIVVHVMQDEIAAGRWECVGMRYSRGGGRAVKHYREIE